MKICLDVYISNGTLYISLPYSFLSRLGSHVHFRMFCQCLFIEVACRSLTALSRGVKGVFAQSAKGSNIVPQATSSKVGQLSFAFSLDFFGGFGNVLGYVLRYISLLSNNPSRQEALFIRSAVWTELSFYIRY